MEKIETTRIMSLEELKDRATFQSPVGHVHVFCQLPFMHRAYELAFYPVYNGSYQHWQKETQYNLWEYYQIKGRWNCSFTATDDELQRHTIVLQALKEGSVHLVTKKQAYNLLEGKAEIEA